MIESQTFFSFTYYNLSIGDCLIYSKFEKLIFIHFTNYGNVILNMRIIIKIR